MTGEKKVGHAGTLDPLAEGVLIVGVGRESTKKLRFVLEEDKEYVGEIKLGVTSTTDDEEGVKSRVKSQESRAEWPTLEEIEKVTKTFIGDIIQISPVYSAIKIGGERAYKKARRGEKFTSPPRIVTIKEIEILDYQLKDFDEVKQSNSSIVPAGKYPILKIRTIVGSGTYIRSLAREIGEKLKTGGYLTSLVRTRIGDYKIKDSIKLLKKNSAS
jgi:tRNA pseudouridine55 synthase